MGRIKDPAVRTKGNTRPSSSLQAAELLASSGVAQPPGYFGLSLFSGAGGADNQGDVNINPEIRLILKKLLKKDVITKQKALEELRTALQSKTDDDIKAMVPSWTRQYNKLVMENDPRVRESSQRVMEFIVQRLHRNLAPFLKNLIGSWWLSFCDPHSPASSLSKNAFQSTFSPQKQIDVLLFCKDEIITMLTENLTVHTTQTLSDPTTTSQEEMDVKYERVIMMTLNATKALILALPKDKLDQFKEGLCSLFGNSKFWKLGKEKSPPMRSSFFSLLAAVCQADCSLFGEEIKQVCSAAFNSLEENDAAIVGPVWELVLSIASHVENWWNFVNVRKSFCPKLWSVCRNGAFGHAAIVFPNFLPLISRLPASVVGEEIGFYNEFFTNLRQSLSPSEGRTSNNRITVTVATIFECISYLIRREIQKNESRNDPLIQFLIESVMLSLIRSYLTEDDSLLPYSKITNHIVEFYCLLQRQMNDRNSAKMLEIQTHWIHQLSSICGECIETTNNSNSTCHLRLMKLIERFSTIKTLTNSDGGANEQNGDVLIHNMMVNLFHLMRQHKDNVNPMNMVKILYYFLSTDLLERFASPSCSSAALELFEQLVLPAFSEQNKTKININPSDIEPLLSVTFSLINAANEAERKNIQDQFLQTLHEPRQLVPILIYEQSHPNDPRIEEFVSFVPFQERLLGALRSLCHSLLDGSEQDWKLLLIFVNAKGACNSELVLKEITSVVQSCSETLREQTKDERAVAFVCHLARMLFGESKIELDVAPAQNLLVTIFSADILSRDMSDAQRRELRSAWGAGMRHIGSTWLCNDVPFRSALLSLIKEALTNLQSVSISGVQRIFETVQFLLAPSRHHAEAQDDVQQLFELTHELITFASNHVFPLSEEKSNSEQWLAGVMLVEPFLSWIEPVRDEAKENVLFLNSALFLAMAVGSLLKLKQTPFASEFIAKLLLGLQLADNLDAFGANESLKAETWDAVTQQLPVGVIAETMRCLNGRVDGSPFGMLNAVTLDSLLSYCCKRDDGAGLDLTREQLHPFVRMVVAKHAMQLGWQYDGEDVAVNAVAALVSLEPSPQSLEELCHLMALLRRCPTESHCACLLQTMLTWRDQRDDLFLYETDLDTAEWPTILFNVSVMRLITALLSSFDCTGQITSEQWDFILCSLASWVKTVTHCSLDKCRDQLFLDAVCRMVSQVEMLIENVHRERLPSQLVVEWTEFFAEGIYDPLLPIFDVHTVAPFDHRICSLLVSLCQAISFAPTHRLMAHQLEPQLDADDCSPIPDHFQTLLNRLCPKLLVSHQSVQLGVHTLLKKCIPELVKCLDADMKRSFNEESDLEHKPNEKLPRALLRVLETTADAVQHLLNDFVLGESIDVHNSDEEVRHFLMSYLLSFDLFMELFQQLPVELKPHYCDFLLDRDYLDLVLTALFSLMPPMPTLEMEDRLSETMMIGHPKMKLDKKKLMFEEKPIFTLRGVWQANEVQHFACWLYYQLLIVFSGMIRSWWSNLKKRDADIIDKFTTKFVTPQLIAKEIETVNGCEDFNDELRVKGVLAAKQVVATYQLEDFSLELIIQLAENHPLGKVTVDGSGKKGVTTKQWRQWQLQLTTYLNNQNGSLMQGIKLWKNNVDKRFSGVEDCMICYSVIHGTSYQLPRMKCRTCRKKFHSICLYKWFNSSNNSTCPLCRNLF